jgi:formate-nitrite transporter family protein
MADQEGVREALKEGRRRTAPSVLEIHEAIRSEGEHELSRPVLALFVSGLAAGLSMGFSFLAEAALSSGLPEQAWTDLISKLGYSVGFLIVILGRQQLFTENTLTPIIALFSHPSRACFYKLARLWVVVLLANLVGATLFAAFLAFTPVVDPSILDPMERISLHVVKPSAYSIFLRAILGGWLIALMVWLLPFAETARPWVILIITYLVGVGHLAHIIAGSVEVLYGVFFGLIPIGKAVGGFMLPALAGNVVGGVALVSMLHHAQIRLDGEQGQVETSHSVSHAPKPAT